MSRPLAAGALLSLLCLSGCAGVASRVFCRAGEERAVFEALYFGTAMPDGQVSAADWQRFLTEVITPRFPDGLTSWVAAGQWQGPDGKLEHESSYVLHVVHRDTPATDAAIREVVAIYKTRFHQQAVLRVRSPACVAF